MKYIKTYEAINMDLSDEEASAIMKIAIKYEDYDKIQKLFDAGYDPNNGKSIISAILNKKGKYSKKDITIIKMFLDAGLDVNMKNKYGYGLLEIAIDKPNLELVRLLIDADADVNYICKSGGRSLLVQILNTYYEHDRNDIIKIIEELIKNGADPLLKDNNSKNFIDYLIYGHHLFYEGMRDTISEIIKKYNSKAYREYQIKYNKKKLKDDTNKYNL